MSEYANEPIITELKGEVLHVTINRPQARNALRIEDKRRLTAAISSTEVARRAVVISGAGDAAFCAGSDLKEMSALDIEQYLEMQYAENALYESIMRSRVPVVAAIQGWALGTGCVLAAACDFVFAETSATFGQPEVLNGAPTPLHGALLPSIIGLNWARWMVMTGRTISASLAQQWGLVHSITPTGEAPVQAIEFAQELADSTHPSSMALQKRIVESWIRHPFDAAVDGSMYMSTVSYGSGYPQSAAGRMHGRTLRGTVE